jgi:hypothetical protein
MWVRNGDCCFLLLYETPWEVVGILSPILMKVRFCAVRGLESEERRVRSNITFRQKINLRYSHGQGIDLIHHRINDYTCDVL